MEALKCMAHIRTTFLPDIHLPKKFPGQFPLSSCNYDTVQRIVTFTIQDKPEITFLTIHLVLEYEGNIPVKLSRAR